MKDALIYADSSQSPNYTLSARIRKQIENKSKGFLLIKKGIWVYFILLIFEGSLRKWFLPQLSTPLLVIRDPVALWIIVMCIKQGFFKVNFYIAAIWIIGFFSLLTTILWGHGNAYVALFGVRIFWIHFPLIFIIPRVFDKQDVIKVGKILLMIVLPMTLLMAVQFFSPQSAWVNRSIGGNIEEIGFGGTLGFFRPPGTFSFISGLAAFYGLAATYVFYFWIDNSIIIKKWFLIIITGCLLVAIPLSISRTVLLQTILSLVFAIIIIARKPKYVVRLFFVIAIGITIFVLLSNVDFFATGMMVFTERMTTATESEGGAEGVLVDRFLGGMFRAITNSNDLPFWGYGLGMGTNVGSMLLSGETTFLIAEAEWARIIGEMGIVLGLMIVCLRVLLTIKMTLKSLKAVSKKNFLPWMLLSFGFFTILQGSWAQPTALGFAVLSGGLILASLNDPTRIRYYFEKLPASN